MNRSPHCIRLTVMLAASAMTIAGCADSRTAAINSSNASAQASSGQGEQPYKTSYGISSDGPTTDLYTELFGSSRRDDGNGAPPASPPQAEPVVASATILPVQPASTPATKPQLQRATASAANRQIQPATSSAANRQVQPVAAPVAAQVTPPPVAPQPPPDPDTPAAYGITSNGPTTDLYTELFGPRRRDGQ